MDHFDIIIVGGGIAGASLGAEVADSARVLLIEAESQPGMHSTGRSAAFWLESYGGSGVAPLSAASKDFLANPPTEFAESGFLSPRGTIHVDSTGRADAFAFLPAAVETFAMSRAELEAAIPGISPRWVQGRSEPGCADIDVAGLHVAYLRQFRRRGGAVWTDARLVSARTVDDRWTVLLEDGRAVTAVTLVDAAGGWADPV